MVIAADTPIPPVYDVVFVVEKTANLAAYLETLKTSYILPTLEYFNGGPPDPTDYGNDFSCTLYALVTFHSGDISPSPAASCEYPTTSTHKFLSYLDETNFIGGEAQSYSHISEGLSTALQVFDEIKATRNHSIPSERHCIMVCNSPPYHLPSQESQDYMGFTSEQLASMLGKRGIYLTIISPRKIPALQRLYEESCTTDIPFTPNKDYTVDPRHMVLLHGFQLQERSHSPSLEEDKQTSELIKSSLVSTSGGRVSSPAPATSTEGQFKVPQPTTGLQNITQQPSPQPHALSPLNPQNINQTVAPQPVPQQQPQPQPPPQQQTSIPAQPSGGLPNQQHQQSNQIGMGPPMSQMTRQVPQANPQAKMAISPAMSTVAQQPQNTMVTMANSMAMNQGNGQQVRPGFPKAQIINITPALQQQVKQEPNQMFMNQRTQPQQQQQQQPQVAGGMIANQQRQAVTMVSTQNPMTSTQGMMGAQGMMTTQAGMMTTQAGMMTTQQGMGTTQPGMMTQNIMTSQGMQQHQNKIRMNMPGQQNMASPQVSMTETVPSIVSQPPMSMPQQGISQQQYMQLPGPKAPQMVIPGPGSAPAVGGQGFPGTDPGVADPTRGAQPNNNKKIIWKGSLEYQEKPKPQGPPNTVQQKNTKTLNCCVSIPNNEPDLNARNWPEKLVMQLLPQPMLHELQSLFRNSRQVSFHFSPNDLDALRNLYRIMGTGFAGCVHFSQTANCDIRVLLLLYSSKKKAFVGLIPNDQGAFVQGIRNVLNKVRNKIDSQKQKLFQQQTQQVNQPMTASLPMPTPPQQMQTAQGIPSNPQMGGMAMQQTMPITSTTTQAQNKLPLQQDQMGNNCIMMPQGQESSGEESMMNRTITNQPGMDMIQGQQDRTSLQRRIQMLENNLQAAKQKELQYQQQEQAKKAALVAQQRQMMEEVYYPGPPPHMYTARQQLQMQQQQQQQQRLQMQASQQQQQQQLHHILLNQQNPQGQQTQQQQQQMRQQLLLQQQQQNMRGAAPQSQQGVMGAPQGQQPMQSQAGVMGAPGGQQSMQSQLAMPQPGQNYLEDFNLPDIM